ncbi:hypothetical protein MACK_003628 [Theileria orientalis]|uniref:FHA domain-containing protein n=1 Tax=Theileria orientalis TaxID=68886 RepID=A0A976SJF7_THEOR|nr:hypothetical protein MACK_003628 [Theileria orientalis]
MSHRYKSEPDDYRSVKKEIKKEDKYENRYKDRYKTENKRELKAEDSKKYKREVVETPSPAPVEKEKPNFEPSGLLAAETNNRNGILLKYSAPEESAMPNLSWRLYIFKSDDKSNNLLKVIKIDEREFYLIGKDDRITDISLYHPSISKQHAVIQYRQIEDEIIPYLIDLNSTNGTFVNDMKLESSKYYELREKDIIKFGYSTREYVLLNDKST